MLSLLVLVVADVVVVADDVFSSPIINQSSLELERLICLELPLLYQILSLFPLGLQLNKKFHHPESHELYHKTLSPRCESSQNNQAVGRRRAIARQLPKR
jgi:hypothetical protein